jgi:hypothetical protein
LMNTTLLSWFDAGWSLDAAARVVALHHRLRPDDAPEAHEAAAVRDEVHALVRGIMAECGLPDPVLRQTKAHEAPIPDIEGETGYVAEESASVSTAPDAMHRLATMVFGPAGLVVTYNDLTGIAARLTELGDRPGPDGDMWWLDAAVVKVLERGDAGAKPARERWRSADAVAICVRRYADPVVEIPHELNPLATPATYLSRAMVLVLDVALARVRAKAAEAAAAAAALEEEVRRRARQSVGLPRPLTRIMTSGAVSDGDRRLVVESNKGRVTVAQGPRIVLPAKALDPMHGLVAAELARMAHRQWQGLVDNASELVFPVGRDALRERFGETGGADELLGLMRDLMAFEVEGFRLVEAVNLRKDTRHSDTGRKALVMRVVVGVPLAPGSLFRKLEDHGIEWPDGERWFSPVLPQHAGGLLERRLWKRERHAVEVVVPSLLMDRRAEYADQGVRPAELAEELAFLTGFNGREATALLERLANQHRGQGELLPVFEPVAARANRYRLGQAYHEAHTMIVGAAEVTEKAQRGAARSHHARRGGRKKS